MKDPIKTNSSFILSPYFQLDNDVDLKWGLYSRKEKYDFVHKSSPHAAGYIREKTWHKEQETKEMEDGFLLLSFITCQID